MLQFIGANLYKMSKTYTRKFGILLSIFLICVCYHYYYFSSPKIKIENGSPQCLESAKPIKKEPKKNTEEKKSLEVKKEPKKVSEDKNTLDVAGADHRRHKKTRDGTKPKPETSKTKHKTKSVEEKNEPKVHKHKKTANKLVKQSSVKENEEVKGEVKKILKSGSGPKPPNVLVYADSLVTKDNVKRVLFSILNKEK